MAADVVHHVSSGSSTLAAAYDSTAISGPKPWLVEFWWRITQDHRRSVRRLDSAGPPAFRAPAKPPNRHPRNAHGPLDACLVELSLPLAKRSVLILAEVEGSPAKKSQTSLHSDCTGLGGAIAPCPARAFRQSVSGVTSRERRAPCTVSVKVEPRATAGSPGKALAAFRQHALVSVHVSRNSRAAMRCSESCRRYYASLDEVSAFGRHREQLLAQATGAFAMPARAGVRASAAGLADRVRRGGCASAGDAPP